MFTCLCLPIAFQCVVVTRLFITTKIEVAPTLPSPSSTMKEVRVYVFNLTSPLAHAFFGKPALFTEDAIRAMLDRDAEEAEDDNLFSIPAGTDFGIPLDDDDDDDDDIGDSFDITYHG